MKDMKITNKTLMVEFQTEATFGPQGAVKTTLLHNAFLSRNDEGKLVADIDLCIDFIDTTFLGNKVGNGFDEFKKFKDTLKGLGIDFDKLVDIEEKKLIDQGIEQNILFYFREDI
jgi:hypothetical protein